jgi:hypothetical protein
MPRPADVCVASVSAAAMAAMMLRRDSHALCVPRARRAASSDLSALRAKYAAQFSPARSMIHAPVQHTRGKTSHAPARRRRYKRTAAYDAENARHA